MIFEGAVLFSTLAQEDNLNVVLNPHSEAREIVYHSNLAWIRNQVEALRMNPGAKVMSNMSGFLPGHADQELLTSDLSAYLAKVTAVERAYLLAIESYDRESNVAHHGVMVFVDSTSTLTEQDAKVMERGFEFKPHKYNLEKHYDLSFMVLPKNDVGEQISKQKAFYHKKN